MSGPSHRQAVLDYLGEHSIVRPKDLVQAGLPKHYLGMFVQEGKVIRIGRGLYQLSEQNISEWHSYLEVQRQVPNGVFCLLSALVFHNFTTQNPHDLWIAIDRKAWQPKVSYPPVRYCTMSGDALNERVETHKVDGVELKVFSAAKTVADCFKYRNKIGLDIAIEALKEGWRCKKFTMSELMACAKFCRVENIIRPYAESLAHS